MGTLPALSGQQVVRIFESFGWRVARQKGSHVIMVKEEHIATLSIPNHKQVAKGTLRSLIRSANLTIDQFVAAARRL
jgi:predicted RNA binding protein YcfA (HicA-like mRNA interferase family)